MLPSAEQRRVIKKLLTRAVEDYRAETHPFGEPNPSQTVRLFLPLRAERERVVRRWVESR